MLREILPLPVFKALKFVYRKSQNGYYRLLDTGQTILGQRDPLVPPRSKIFIGTGDYKQTGLDFRKHFIDLGKLKPNERVLDIGCGIGRMAGPLTSYLDQSGSYEGFDIVEYGIDWCQKNITPRFPNFNFQLANIHNDHYNPKGHVEASKYAFPFDDDEFDFAFLTSVFTHMTRPEVENYMAEISRVLKPGGRCLITFFLLNSESRDLMKTPKSANNIQHYVDGRYIAFYDDPEACVGFDEIDVIKMFDKNGMIPATYPGSWCGREKFISFQDIVVAHKR